MPLSRRTAILLVGGGIVTAATAGAAGFLATRTPERALEPWRRAGQYYDPRMNALSWAILAPNPHNRQPWIADLRQPGQIALFRDPARNLPHTDPFNRQLTIGMGCFIELLAIAASSSGHAVSFELFPQGEAGPVAIARFAEGASPDPLFAFVPHRRSCKQPFEERTVAADLITRLTGFATIIDEPGKVEALRQLTWDAWKIEFETPRTNMESVNLMRFGKAEINASPDGIALGGGLLEAMMLVGALNRKAQADPQSFGSKEGARIYERMLMATPAYAVLVSPSNSPLDHIEAGRRWLRLNLATTSMGLALHPVSQVLQEYKEMATLYARAHEMLAPRGHSVQMLGRLGYGPPTPPTPRWPLESRLLDG